MNEQTIKNPYQWNGAFNKQNILAWQIHTHTHNNPFYYEILMKTKRTFAQYFEWLFWK